MPTVAKMQQTEKLLIRKAQLETFETEILTLEAGEKLDSKSRLFSFSPNLDCDGVLRIHGRTERAANLGSTTKCPALLDPDHKLTILLVDKYHVDAHHQEQEFVLNELRQRYWILRGRQAVRSSWSRFLLCSQHGATPTTNEMASLPECRLRALVYTCRSGFFQANHCHSWTSS